MIRSSAKRTRTRGLLMGLVCLLIVPNSYAQRAESVEEVVVTAQRRATDLQDTSISASVLSGEVLEDKNIETLEFLQYSAPNVKISHFGSANVFNIRGIGRTEVDIEVPSGVVIYRDGAPTIAGYFQTEPYYDLKSVEILRGPQGTFVGKSASGGAVFINTNDPEFDEELSGSIEAGYGSQDMKEATAIANIPLTDTLAARASYRHLDSNDYFESIDPPPGSQFGNSGTMGDRDMDSYRLGIRWAPNDNFEGKIKLDHHSLDFGGNAVHSYGGDPLRPMNEGDIFYKDVSTRLVVDLGYQFDNGYKIKSLNAYQYLRSDNSFDSNADLAILDYFESHFDVEIWTTELNIISPEEDRFRWIAGFLFFQQEANLFEPEENGFQATAGYPGFSTDFPYIQSPWYKHEDEWSVFGHVSFDVTEKLEIAAGTRYSDYFTDQVTNWEYSDGSFPATLSYAADFFGLPAGYVKQELSEGSLDWQVALNYTLNEEHFVYALASRGHTVGGINILPPFELFNEMEVTNYELGWKAKWMENQVRTQATVFYLDLDDYIINFEPAGALGIGTVPLNRNAPGETSITGVELSAQAQIGQLSGDMNFSYTWSDLGNADGFIDPLTGLVEDRSGIELPFLSPLIANVGLAYDFRVSSQHTFTPRVDVSYSDGYSTKIWDHPELDLEDRTLVNLNLVLTPDSDKWAVSFWMTNVLDHHYASAIQLNGLMRYTGRPREFGGRIKLHF